MEIRTQLELPADRAAASPPEERQIPLFGKPEPRARPAQHGARLAASADPISSHLAAAELNSSGRRAAQKNEVLAWLRAQGRPLTSMEIAHGAGLDRYMCARRLPDLEKDGLVERCAMRQCTASNRPAITWRTR